MQETVCLNCATEYKFNPRISAGKYCSNKCQLAFQRKTRAEAGQAGKKGLRAYLIEHTDYRCRRCGLSEWLGEPLTLQMDHLDGDSDNNVIENVRWLCPNCHSQTPNWGVANVSAEGRKRLASNTKTTSSAPV